MRKFLSILSFFCAFLFIHGIGCNIFPVDDVNNVVYMPVWYSFALILVPFFIARIIWKGSVKKAFKFGSEPIYLRYSPEPFKIPSSRKERNSLALDLALDIQVAADKANKSRSVAEFVKWYDFMVVRAEKLSKLNGKVTSIKNNLLHEYFKLQDDFQKHLRDSIDRSGDEIIELKKGGLKYENEIICKKIMEYKSEIDAVSPRFDEETKEYARIKYRYVCHECKMASLLDAPETVLDKNEIISDEQEWRRTRAGLAPIEAELIKVDAMEGRDFEYWCADLLKKSGFENVEVTQGSGDQGVDVLAEKGGIKYAIQCKCYSSDLGNTPVQEVNAGKAIYHCHIGVVMTNRHFTAGAQQAAEATNTLLWDRESIAKMLKEANT